MHTYCNQFVFCIQGMDELDEFNEAPHIVHGDVHLNREQLHDDVNDEHRHRRNPHTDISTELLNDDDDDEEDVILSTDDLLRGNLKMGQNVAPHQIIANGRHPSNGRHADLGVSNGRKPNGGGHLHHVDT